MTRLTLKLMKVSRIHGVLKSVLLQAIIFIMNNLANSDENLSIFAVQ